MNGANLFQMLNTNAPAEMGAAFSPEAIQKRRLADLLQQEQMAQAQEAGSLRSLLSQNAGADSATLAQKAQEAGLYKPAQAFKQQAYQEAQSARQAQQDAEKQRDEVTKRNVERAVFVAGLNPERNDAWVEVLRAKGVQEDQIPSIMQSLPADPQERMLKIGMTPEKYAELVFKERKAAGPEGGKIGNYNPGDYTPGSFAKFLTTKNPADLVRYQAPERSVLPTVVNIGNVPTLVDRRTGQTTPLASADVVAQNVQATKPSSEKSLTEAQSNAFTFANRMSEADAVINEIGGKYSPMALRASRAVEGVPGLGIAANYRLSPNDQRMEQAKRDFTNAVLRKESGAAISASEFDNADRQYFPQPGDSAQVIEQKRRNRKTAIDGISEAAGPAKSKIGGGARPPVLVSSEAEWNALKPGTAYTMPDGRKGVK